MNWSPRARIDLTNSGAIRDSLNSSIPGLGSLGKSIPSYGCTGPLRWPWPRSRSVTLRGPSRTSASPMGPMFAAKSWAAQAETSTLAWRAFGR